MAADVGHLTENALKPSAPPPSPPHPMPSPSAFQQVMQNSGPVLQAGQIPVRADIGHPAQAAPATEQPRQQNQQGGNENQNMQTNEFRNYSSIVSNRV